MTAIKGKKRSKDVIIAQILQVCMSEASKTCVVYQTNLNFHTVMPYLNSLIKNGMIDILPGKVPQYRTTKKGIDALKKLQEIQKLFGQTSSGD